MQPTILIVEDHEAVRRRLAEWLHVSFPACRILEVGSAEEALRVSETERLDLIIVDIHLPLMNGLEASRQIKARQPKSRIVVLSLYDDLAQRARAGDIGASAFVSKQTMHSDLLPVLETLLPRRARQRSRLKVEVTAGSRER